MWWVGSQGSDNMTTNEDLNTVEIDVDEEIRERRQSGYLPLHPPIFRRLWRLRTSAVPSLCTFSIPNRPPRKSKSKKKSRGLKTPRLMLPILLG